MLRFVSALLCLTSSAFAQQYPFIAVKAPNPPENLKGLFQDRVGRLWVSTPHGVACFDGTRFYDLRDLGYPDTEVLTVSDDDDGGIWIGSRLGIHRLSKGNLVRVHDGVVRSLVRAAPGIMLAGVGPTGKDLWSLGDLVRIRRNGSSWISETIPGLQVSLNLSVGGPNQSITFGTQSTWVELSPQAITNWRPGVEIVVTSHALPGMNVVQVLRDRFDCVWFRNDGYTAYQCPGNPQLQTIPPTVANSGKLMSEANDGRMLLPGEGIFALGRPGSFQVAKPLNGLPPVEAALFGADGTLWIGGGKGLFHFAYPFHFEYWNERDGLADVTSVLRMGSRAFAADVDGIKQLSGDRRSWSLLPKLPDLGRVYHMIAGPSETIYASLYYQGVEQLVSCL